MFVVALVGIALASFAAIAVVGYEIYLRVRERRGSN